MKLEDRIRDKTAALIYKSLTLNIPLLVITAIDKCVSNLFPIFFFQILEGLTILGRLGRQLLVV